MSREPNSESPIQQARDDLAEVESLVKELADLRIVNPDSTQIEVLKKLIVSKTSSAENKLEQHQNKMKIEVQEARRGLEKIESLNLEIQRQLITLSATLIVALLALSEVFEDTPGIRTVVGEASSNLIYTIGASLLTIVFFGVSSVNNNLFKDSSLILWTGKVAQFLHVIFSALTFYFFFQGLLELTRFLSAM